LESSITFSPILAVEPQNEGKLMNVYPNPVLDKINIQFKQASSGVLNVINKRGQNLYSEKISLKNEHFINAVFLPAGDYIISFKNEKGDIVNQKVVK